MKSGAEGIDELPFNVARKTGTSTQVVAGGTSRECRIYRFCTCGESEAGGGGRCAGRWFRTLWGIPDCSENLPSV